MSPYMKAYSAARAALCVLARGLSLKGSSIERQRRVNSDSRLSLYSVIFLSRITCGYVSFDLWGVYLEYAQALLLSYFDALKKDNSWGYLRLRSHFLFKNQRNLLAIGHP